MSSAVCWDRSENNSPSDRSMRETSISSTSRLVTGFASRAVRRQGLGRHRIAVAELGVKVAVVGLGLRRAMEETRDAEADRDGGAEERRRTATAETMDVVHHVGDAFLTKLIRESA